MLERQLPRSLAQRVHGLISRDWARLLWQTKQKFVVDDAMRQSLSHLLSYVDHTSAPWEVPLGMIVPRQPHFYSRGDASHLGGGGYCDQLEFWFDIAWSPRTIYGTKKVRPGRPGYVHINFLEFIVVILQLAAVRVRIDTATLTSSLGSFHVVFPIYPFGMEKQTTLFLSPGRIEPQQVPPNLRDWYPFMQNFFGRRGSTPSVNT